LTPNPCILCNRYIKFPYLIKFAEERGAQFIATGHYARVERDGFPLLKKGIDLKKDQSYVLYILKRSEIERLVLPLGYRTKEEVRRIALSLDLPAARRPESQEICFIEDRNYFKLLNNILPSSEGPIIEAETGKVIGTHRGIHLFTIGQRKRLGISTGKPLYVVRIDPSERAVYVGPKEMALKREFEVCDINWLIQEDEIQGRFHATVKVRSMMRDEPATVTLLNKDSARVTFDEPQWAPAPGQYAVFYDKDTVIGGGIIR
ncbi:MAG: tRNA 2-thiouridine(34) synthase MnmA, partial [Thermodesulfovibrionales bacterium]